jgi:hypothetical protein
LRIEHPFQKPLLASERIKTLPYSTLTVSKPCCSLAPPKHLGHPLIGNTAG